MTDTATQQTLLDRSLAGDAAATEQLLLLNYEWLSRCVERQIPSDLQGLINAEDVLQETFVRVFRSIRRFRPQANASFAGWLKTIAEHQLIDLMKRRRRERLVSGELRNGANQIRESHLGNLIEQIADDDGSPPRGAMLGEVQRLLPVAVAGLPEDQRTVLQLLYMEGRSLDEVAQAMGRSTDAVRGLCHRARKQLRADLLRLSSYL